jgi:L-ascorbate metabolism protein UlaG (beta-lactamase superfamily)
MKITKYLHACLLVEEANQTFLFDPGNFTYLNKALAIDNLKQLDYILLTHEHDDHCYLPFIKELVAKFPKVQIITNQSVKQKLETEHIAAQTTPIDPITFENAPHERLWDKEPPENTAITILNKLTHVGDSLQFTKTAEILALPLNAPWGSTTACVNKALELKPQYIIPIHDYLWRDEVRQMMYKRLTEFFAAKSISFKGLEAGEIITL